MWGAYVPHRHCWQVGLIVKLSLEVIEETQKNIKCSGNILEFPMVLLGSQIAPSIKREHFPTRAVLADMLYYIIHIYYFS